MHIYPHRKIIFPNELPPLYWSEWFTSTMEYILLINLSLRGKTLQDIDFNSIPPQYLKVTELLNSITQLIDTFPPFHQNQRFGNTAFRDWFDAVQPTAMECMKNIVSLVGMKDSDYNPEIGLIIGDFKKRFQQHLADRTAMRNSGSKPQGMTTEEVLQFQKEKDDRLQLGFTPQTPNPFTSHSTTTSQSTSLSNHTETLSATAPHTAQRANPLTHHLKPGSSPSVRSTPTPTPSSLPHNSPSMQSISFHPSSTPPDLLLSPTTISHTSSTSSTPTPPSMNRTLKLKDQEPIDPRIALPCSLSQELTGYLLESFGNYIRIDYGTGHELAFITFLTALHKAKIFPISTPNEAMYVGIVIFSSYLTLVRRLQSIYWLEPAGSKGAWGLDDYQFISFLWGSSQFIGLHHKLPQLPPLSEIFANDDIQQRLMIYTPGGLSTHESNSASTPTTTLPTIISADDVTPLSNPPSSTNHNTQSRGLLFIDALSFVQQTKRGLLQHTAPVLFSLSSVRTWDEINDGLLRMFGGEVIAKFPVMQHVKFGSLLKLDGEERMEMYRLCYQSRLEATLPSGDAASDTEKSVNIEPSPHQSEEEEEAEHLQPNSHTPSSTNSISSKKSIDGKDIPMSSETIEKKMKWFEKTSKMHIIFRIPPTITDIDSTHQHNVKLDAALIIRTKK